MRTAASLTKKSPTSYKNNLRNLYNKPISQVSTALILTIFAIVFFAVFAIKPTLATIVELNKNIEDLGVVVEKLEKKSVALATAQSEYLLIEHKVPLIDAAIPKTNNLDTLLKQIEGIAAMQNLPIDGLQVDEIIFPEEISDKKKVGEVISLPLSITISSRYSNIRSFISLLSEMKRLVSIESISFSSEALETGEQLKMTIQVKSYHLPDKEVLE